MQAHQEVPVWLEELAFSVQRTNPVMSVNTQKVSLKMKWEPWLLEFCVNIKVWLAMYMYIPSIYC